MTAKTWRRITRNAEFIAYLAGRKLGRLHFVLSDDEAAWRGTGVGLAFLSAAAHAGYELRRQRVAVSVKIPGIWP